MPTFRTWQDPVSASTHQHCVLRTLAIFGRSRRVGQLLTSFLETGETAAALVAEQLEVPYEEGALSDEIFSRTHLFNARVTLNWQLHTGRPT